MQPESSADADPDRFVQNQLSIVTFNYDRSFEPDGGFRRDGTIVPLPLHDVATLTEAFHRADEVKWLVTGSRLGRLAPCRATLCRTG